MCILLISTNCIFLLDNSPSFLYYILVCEFFNARRFPMKGSFKTILIVGFALFSMLFGAGNVIFPPYLGLGCGSRWIEGFLYYYIADIGLALACLFAISRIGGHRAITRRLGPAASELLICVIILCIGPMLGIPRTAASTFEMSVLPLFPRVNPVLFSVLFFALIAVLCLKESAVVDIIGKMLTPMLMVGLVILIVQGCIHPIGPVSGKILVDNVPVTGIQAGYQTMDVLAVVIFGILISKSVTEKGFTKLYQQRRIVFGAGMVAGVSLLAMYLGLTYLGVTASGMFDLTVDHTFLVTTIVHMLLGQTGTIIFAVVVALACITTAVALVSSCADYFSNLTGGRIRYVWLVIVICGFSSVVTTFGLNQIIAIAAPILDVVYPPTLLIIVLSYFDKWIKNDWVFRLGALGACLVSVLTVAQKFGAPLDFLNLLPLHSYGFSWLVPALIFAAAGFLVPGRNK